MNSLVSRFNHKHIVGIRAIVTGPSQWVLHRHRKPEPSLEAGTTKLRLPYCGPIVRRQGSSESTGCRGEWTQQEKRETTQEADRLHKSGRRHESEQGCRGRDPVAVSHSQGGQESEPVQRHGRARRAVASYFPLNGT